MYITIRLAKTSNLPAYTSMHQEVYEHTYVFEAIGLTKDCFSKEVFLTPSTQEYLLSNLQQNTHQKCWLAFLGKELIGSISIVERENDCELRGFYVVTKQQGKGIGKKLWMKTLAFAKKKHKDITLDIYAHNMKTIALYKKWGFIVDESRGNFFRHWPEWPEDVQAKSFYMRYKII